MIRKRILLINTFPIANPQGGGQKRQAAFVEAYKKAFTEVKYVSVFFKGFYKEYDSTDIALPDHLTSTVHASPHTADLLAGKAIFDESTVKRRMIDLLTSFRPDIIQIEQAFPYAGLKPLLAELGIHPQLIYSSHNIEYLHKQEILESVHMSKPQIDAVVEEIKDIELELTERAGLVIACTEADRAFYQEHGAKHSVLARNGMAPIRTTEAAITHWKAHFAQEFVNKKALFVGAAHPPNWVGIRQMIGLNVGFLPFDSRLVLAGGIADHFRDSINEEYNPSHTTFWQRVELVTRPSDEALGALLTAADVIVLPITEGGGSNLKTAEAILADKTIVATSHAFRSFEPLRHLPNIYIADKPAEFRESMVRAFAAPRKERTAEERVLADSVLWKHCLNEAVKEVAKL
jgi:hypothetical protein